MTQRITDQELDAMIAALTIQGSKARLALARELKAARVEIASLKTELVETYQAKRKAMEELQKVLSERFHASAFMDCEAKLKRYEDALRFYAGMTNTLDGGRRAQEALK